MEVIIKNWGFYNYLGNKSFKNDLEMIMDMEQKENCHIRVLNSQGKDLYAGKSSVDKDTKMLLCQFKNKRTKIPLLQYNQKNLKFLLFGRNKPTIYLKEDEKEKAEALEDEGFKVEFGDIDPLQFTEIIEKLELIDMIKDDYSIQNLAKSVIYNMFKNVVREIDYLRGYEYEFYKHNTPSFIYEPLGRDAYNSTYKFDINSAYAYALKEVMMPTLAPKIGTLKNIDHLYGYSVYVVRLSIDCTNFKYMKSNDDGYYCNIDVDFFINNNISFKLIEEENNLIYWGKCDLMPIPDKLINHLYGLKVHGNKIAGKVLQRLHGIMTQTNYKKFKRTGEDDDEDVPLDVLKYCIKKTKDYYHYMAGGSPFKYVFIRIKPFLYAYIRKYLYEKFLSKCETVYRVYIDSIETDTDLRMYVSPEIGMLKEVPQ